MKPGKTHQPRRVENLRVAGLDPVAHLGDDAVAEQHVGASVAAGGGIDDAASADEERVAHASPSQGCPPRRR